MDTNLPLPDWAFAGNFYSISRTSDELSIICPEKVIPTGINSERGWRAIKVIGPLDFSLTGVLSSLLVPLAAAKISILSLSTYETDFVFVRAEDLKQALRELQAAGHQLI